jgi:hypothetical protein
MWGKRRNSLRIPCKIWIKEIKAMSAQTQYLITNICDEIKNMLIQKNQSYGDSAVDPIRIFSKSDNVEQLLVRIDDKLSRIQNGHDWPGDNEIDDLLGYLILLKIAKERAV